MISRISVVYNKFTSQFFLSFLFVSLFIFLNRNELKKKRFCPTRTSKAKTAASLSPCSHVMDVFTADRIALRKKNNN